MDPNLPSIFGEHTEKAVGDALSNVSGDLTKGIGKTFGDLWFLVCGGISKAADMKRLKIACDLEAFKDEVEFKIKSIPPEKLVEPKFQTIGPALEKAKFCVEEPELREMFANLIASAMNTDKASKVQPCFPGIIEQMTPLDAQNLSLFKHSENLPIANYIHKGEKGTRHMASNVFISNPRNQNIEQQAVSITNLDRLGLVTIDPLSKILREGVYEPFLSTSLYKAMTLAFESGQLKASGVVGIDITRGIVTSTPLGKDFLAICLP